MDGQRHRGSDQWKCDALLGVGGWSSDHVPVRLFQFAFLQIESLTRCFLSEWMDFSPIVMAFKKLKYVPMWVIYQEKYQFRLVGVLMSLLLK